MPKRYLRKSHSEKNLDELDNPVSPVFRLVPTLVTLLAVPRITLEIDLLVAPISAACRIRNIVLLDLCDDTANGKVLRVVMHAQLLVFDLLNRLELIAAETPTGDNTTST